MTWEAAPSGRRGRQQACSDGAIQACLTLKVLFGLPLRQTTGFVESLLNLVGLDWSVPDFSTLCRRQRTLFFAIPYKTSVGPLHLLIDGTGTKAEGEREWNARKHGGPKRRLCSKIHIGIDEETMEIRAIEVTSSGIGDGAYDTSKCPDAIASRNAHAVILELTESKPPFRWGLPQQSRRGQSRIVGTKATIFAFVWLRSR